MICRITLPKHKNRLQLLHATQQRKISGAKTLFCDTFFSCVPVPNYRIAYHSYPLDSSYDFVFERMILELII